MLRRLQIEQRAWTEKNFGERPAWHPLLGLVEEIGELAHAYLKREQGIRGTRAEHNEAIRDAIGDIVIYLCDFCSREHIDLQDAVTETWGRVSRRDWKTDPVSGGEGG